MNLNGNGKHACRLCYYETTDTVQIFGEQGNTFDYKGKIAKYLYLLVSCDDDLPKRVCWMCTQNLDTFHRFYEKINEIQRNTLAAKYDEFCIAPRSVAELQTVPVTDKADRAADCAVNADDDKYSYEILVFSDGSEARPSDDIDADVFELIEVTQSESPTVVSPTVVSTPPSTPNKRDDKERYSTSTPDKLLAAESTAGCIEISVNIAQGHARRSARVSRRKADPKQLDPKEPVAKKKAAKANKTNADKIVLNETRHDDISVEYTVADEPNDIGLCGGADDSIGHDSDNDEWPAQGTFDDFPTNIIQDGLIQIKGEQMMSLISRFYRMDCKLCPSRQRFGCLKDLFAHYKESHQQSGYVECCQAKLLKYPTIMMHMARHLQPEAFKCDECGYIVTRPNFLKSHKQTHLPSNERPFKCMECGRRFCWKNALRIHMLSHRPAAERPQYVCAVCNREYDTSSGLSTHKKLAHSGYKKLDTHVCHICAKNFATRTGLHEHMATIHRPREQGQVRCLECGKWLMNNRCLKTHMVLHSSIELRCDQCDYTTKKQALLNRHRITQHTTAKPFKCHLCGRAFKVKRALTIHIGLHNSTDGFKCPFCDREFKSSTNYYAHRKHSHPVELAALKEREEEEKRQKRIGAGVERVDNSD